MDYKGLGQRIKEERLKQNLTQDQFAEKVSLSRQYITFLESGNRKISVATLEKIADYFKVSTDYLIKGVRPSKYDKAIYEFEQMIKEFDTEKEIAKIMDIINAVISRSSK